MFCPGLPYRCSPSVALRPEPFGALAYDFSTRRLSFLKSLELVEVVRRLEHHRDVHAALDAAGVHPERHGSLLAALASLCDTGTIEPRGGVPA
ncbi:mycofactocin biosynthesis chaperone MftB [Streptomyces sp. NPDC004647]|uniref:mycofactocin biosynthesis chaperone MftB n=1 Tax=Streptomyces sp. NPDC004647 TaxID=3154671 RepID=UPI0033A8F023